MALSGNDKMIMNAILERMLDLKSNTFNAEEAKQFIHNMPLDEVSGDARIKAVIGGKNRSEKTTGYAEGIGNVNVENEEKKTSYETNKPYEAIGKYRVFHNKVGRIRIEHMWVATAADFSGKMFYLEYDEKNGVAKELKVLIIEPKKRFTVIPWYSFSIGWHLRKIDKTVISYKDFQLWKKPE